MNFYKFVLILVSLNILSVICEPRRGGGGSRGGGSRGGSRGSSGGGFSSWFRPSSSRPSSSPVSRPSPVYRPAPAPRPVPRPAPRPITIYRPSGHSTSHQGKPPAPGWNVGVAPPPYTRYTPKHAPPAYGAPSFASRPHPPPYTPSVGHNPYHHSSAPVLTSQRVSPVGSAAGNYPRQTYTPVTTYSYPVVNSGYGYGYSPRVINNYYSSPSYYHRSGSSDLLTAYSYYNLGRISGHSHYYHNHNYYHRNYNGARDGTTTESSSINNPITAPVLNANNNNTTSNQTDSNIPRSVDLTKQKLFDPIQVPFENVSKHQIDYQPLYLNESVDQLPFYGVEHLTWNDTYFVPKLIKEPEVTGFGAKIGNMFYSLVSWFSKDTVNEDADKTPYVYVYETEAPPISTEPPSGEEKFMNLLAWRLCITEHDPETEKCAHLKQDDVL